MKKLLTRKELCEVTNGKLTMWTIGELTRRKEIPAIKIPGMKVILYDLSEIEKWIDKLQQSTVGNEKKLLK